MKSLRGELTVPGDKSIAQRAVILGSIAEGDTMLTQFPAGGNCARTVRCMQLLAGDENVIYDRAAGTVTIHGRGLRGLHASEEPLFCGGSATLARLLSGVLAGQDFDSVIAGDQYLSARPMGRVLAPLTQMGAAMDGEHKGSDGITLPIRISGGHQLHGMTYQMPVVSASIKTLILFASLYADGPVTVIEKGTTRDYGERMLKTFGADIAFGIRRAALTPGRPLRGIELAVPGDLSSAAFFIAAAMLVPGSDIIIRNIDVNPTRSGFIDACRAMGGDIELLDMRGEGPTADIRVRSSQLHPYSFGHDVVDLSIDEVTLLAMLACFADGETVITGAEELRIKECDRIDAMTVNLTAMGADIEELPDGWVIRGGRPLHRAQVDARGDHRIAMGLAVARLASNCMPEGDGTECVGATYPDFFEVLHRLQEG